MSIQNTGKKSILRGIFATKDSDLGPGHEGTFANIGDKKLQQSEGDIRLAARRARGVIEDDEPRARIENH